MNTARKLTELSLGQVVITPAAQEALTSNEIYTALNRHTTGDWGEVCKADSRANDDALKNGDRILSVYMSVDGDKFWIITEWDRSVTTILLPSDY